MRTRTSSFGTPQRESHDSAQFYRRRLYKDWANHKSDCNEITELAPDSLNKLYHADSSKLDFIPDNSVHLMITSPPYNVGKEYDADLSLEEYCSLLTKVMAEIYRILIPGGRACVNIANVGRRPYLPLNNVLSQIMIELGFLMRGEIIWDKGASAGSSCAWGSWQSASNPVLRDVHEYIMVFSKQSFKREDNKGLKKPNSITRDEFLEYTKSIWSFNAESAKRVNHPAPFPVELPYRLIQLYSFEGDIVIDPFCGSGTTCLAALKTKRNYLGIDNNRDYLEIAEKRISVFKETGAI